MRKKYLDQNVFEATKERISYIFDTFPRIYLSFSGGKDSTVMLHMVMEEAIKRQRKIAVMFIDWEVQYKITIDHVQKCFDLYRDHIEPYWLSIPLKTVNAVSMFEPEWTCWERGKNWVREAPEIAIKDGSFFNFYRYAMTFEQFIEEFGNWYSDGKLCVGFVGIRCDESLNRYRAIVKEKSNFDGKKWTTWKSKHAYNAYPIYDWKVDDIWIYHAKTQKPYNALYDLMYKAGLTLHQMRICEPFGNEQRRGLGLFHIIEPETWGRVVGRVNGANSGALYAAENGNILGNTKITKPENHTWKSFALMLLETMPSTTSDHYKDKIAVYLKWYRDRGYPEGIEDSMHGDTGSKDMPSWRRICKIILKNDYWCKGLCFSPTKTASYERYKKMMKMRREKWNLI